MKQRIAAALAAVALLSCAGCGAEAPAEPAPAGGAAGSAAASATSSAGSSASSEAAPAGGGVTGSGVLGGEAWSFAGTVFTCGGADYDLAARSTGVTCVMDCTPIGAFLLVEGHINPDVGYYGVFDPAGGEFVREFFGAGPIWRDGDVESIVYERQGSIYGYDGELIGSCELDQEAGAYICGLSFTEDGGVAAEITDNTTEGVAETVVFALEP